VNGYIIGPHFFNGTLTSAMYNDFLQNTLPQLLKDDLTIRQRLDATRRPLLIMLVMCEILWIRYSSIVRSEGVACKVAPPDCPI